MTQRLMEGGDFFEGVRAVVIDKDMTPKWRPETLVELTTENVEAFFRPLGEKDLTFPA